MFSHPLPRVTPHTLRAKKGSPKSLMVPSPFGSTARKTTDGAGESIRPALIRTKQVRTNAGASMPHANGGTGGAPLSKGKMKKLARVAALQSEKLRLAKLRETAGRRDLLECYPAFRKFERHGVAASLEGRHGTELSEDDVIACLALQSAAHAETPFEEEAARAALRHDESRVLLMRAPPTPTSPPASPKPPVEDDEDDFTDWDLVPEASALGLATPSPPSAPEPTETGGEAPTLEVEGEAGEEAPSPGEPPSPGAVLGYLHLQFAVAKNQPPLLCVLNMQLAPSMTGKGLGKFALQLVELMALQSGMELVMMYMKDGEVQTMRLTRNRRPTSPESTFKQPSSGAAIQAKAKELSGRRGQRSPQSPPAEDEASMDEAFELVSWPPHAMMAGTTPQMLSVH